MQLASSTDTATKRGKANGKRRAASEKETIHLKTKKAAVIDAAINQDLDGQIATAAYYLAEQRGFAPGHELEDWLTAEQLVRSRLV
jgi:DUF2934 family protein